MTEDKRSNEGRRDTERRTGDRRTDASIGHDPERRTQDRRTPSDRRLGERRAG